MKNTSNTIARLILLVVGGLIIFAAVQGVMAALNELNNPAVGWWNFGNEASRNAMVALVSSGFNGIIGLTAFFAAVRGRRSFWLFVFSLLLMFKPVYTVVTQVQAGTFDSSFENIGRLILEFLTPILYFVGCILLVRRKND